MDNYRTTSSDACFALSRVISNGSPGLYANKKDSQKIKVENVQGASEQDDAQNIRLILGKGDWKGEHKLTYRAMYVKGRWIRKKVVELLDLKEHTGFIKL